MLSNQKKQKTMENMKETSYPSHLSINNDEEDLSFLTNENVYYLVELAREINRNAIKKN